MAEETLIQVKIPKVLARQLKIYAAKHDTTMSSVVTNALVMTSEKTMKTMKRANANVGCYVMHLYCCAPSDEVDGDACNYLQEFTGEGIREALEQARATGWKVRPGLGGAWCPSHASRTFEQRCADMAERAQNDA